MYSALGLAGAAVAAKSAVGGVFGGGSNQISQGYGPSYGYNSGGYNSVGYSSGPSLTTSYPSPTYVTSQAYVPPQTYAPPQPAYVQQSAYVQQPPSYVSAPQSSFGNPISSALAWKAGIANNLVGGISSGFNGISNGLSGGFANSVQQPIGYSYGAPPPPPPPSAVGGPVPNKPVYVVCDNN